MSHMQHNDIGMNISINHVNRKPVFNQLRIDICLLSISQRPTGIGVTIQGFLIGVEMHYQCKNVK